ncbi:MAG: phosphate acyltransferase [Thermoleophilaceae bacterium]|jgi:glycerol-3-phosphate acyltransferase PlsX|nr:phosphate acyltransferase [Thermoleophilaceae bacterium]MEA2369177.1 phosphate acyltransferase [Thermoleophilaceae bacterium]MEA2387871.1 phosphate acyltransferase [Thermoleophilaceae bacterium]
MIALDANGSDRGPRNVAEGGRRAGVPVTIFGPAAELDGFENVVDAPVAITNDDDPARAVRAKPDASMVQAARAVKDGRAGGFVTSGSTGAALAAGLFHLKRMRGVHRPAVAVRIPIPGRPVLILDCGANVDSRPEWLVQFAYMGAAFMEAVHGVDRARVGLLSIGEEPKKGTDEVVEANRVLSDGPLDFVGNVEGNDIAGGQLDVVVTDGFTGNVALKAVEGTAITVMQAVRDAVRSGPVSTLGGLLIRKKARRLRDELNQDAVGAGILLGLRGVAFVTHGNATPVGVATAVRAAHRAVEEGVVERTEAALRESGTLAAASAAAVSVGGGS